MNELLGDPTQPPSPLRGTNRKLFCVAGYVLAAITALGLGWCMIEQQRLTLLTIQDLDVYSQRWGKGLYRVIRQVPNPEPSGEPVSVYGDFRPATLVERHLEVLGSKEIERSFVIVAVAAGFLSSFCFLVLSGSIRLQSLFGSRIPRPNRISIVSSASLGVGLFCGLPHLMFSGWILWWPGFNGKKILADPQWDASAFLLGLLQDVRYPAAWCLLLAAFGAYCLFAQLSSIRHLARIDPIYRSEFLKFRRGICLYVALFAIAYSVLSVLLGQAVVPNMLLPRA